MNVLSTSLSVEGTGRNTRREIGHEQEERIEYREKQMCIGNKFFYGSG